MTSATTQAWLAGAAVRREEPLAVDDPAEIRRRVDELASRLYGGQPSWLDCPVCELDGGPYGLDEAGQLAGVHDDLHHGGRPTATVLAGSAA